MERVFDRIIVVMFENQFRTPVMENPFMNKLARAGASMTNYFGCFHPSQTNYLASVAGEVCGITNDTPPDSPLLQPTIVDLLEDAGLSWKAYMEGFPEEPWDPVWQKPTYPPIKAPLAEFPNDGEKLARYFRKHNPFASFHKIQSQEHRWQRIVTDWQLWQDLERDGNDLPSYSWFSPDIWNDGHYLSNTHIEADPRTHMIPQISTWLEHIFLGDQEAAMLSNNQKAKTKQVGLNLNLDLLLHNPTKAWQICRLPPKTLLVITFDEADFNAKEHDTNYDGPNQIYTVLLGDMIKPGTQITQPANHYNLLKTIQKNFHLPNLGKNDRDAAELRFLWGQSFQWSKVQSTNIADAEQISTVRHQNKAILTYTTKDQHLMLAEFQEDGVTPGEATGLSIPGPFAMADLSDRLHCFWIGKDGTLYLQRQTAKGTWSRPQPLAESAKGLCCLAFEDLADGVRKLMLCWRDDVGFMWSKIGTLELWDQPTQAVGHLTDGPMTLAQLGGSLFLIYKERHSLGMRMTSYNVAPFNSFKARTFQGDPAPTNDTTLHQWRGRDVAVGSFAKGRYSKFDYQTGSTFVTANIEGAIHLFHRGPYVDTPSVNEEVFGLTGIMSYQNDAANHFGSLIQAGWVKENVLKDVQLTPDGVLSALAFQSKILVIWQDQESGTIKFKEGSYTRTEVEQKPSVRPKISLAS